MELLREDTIIRLKGYFDLAKPAPITIAGNNNEKRLIRPDARKFLVRCSRCNINFSVQQRIFAKQYKWTFRELLEVLVDPQYRLEVLPNHNPFEKLCQAIESNNQEVITRLLHSPQVDLSTHNFHLLYVASQFGNLEVVKHLLTIPNVDLNTDNPMVIACEFGHYEIAKLLYERGADPSIADSFSFRLAAENGHPEIVKLFIHDKRINVNAQEEYAVKQACEENHYQVIKILFDHPAVNYHNDLYSPILVDCVHHGGKLLKTLLADNRIGYPGSRRMSKLFGYANVNYSLETCKILLADGRVDPANFFPEDSNDVNVIELLMKDSRFYSTQGKMESCLFVAAKKGWLSVVQTLFNEFDIHFQEKKDIKAEFFESVIFPLASKSGHVDIMKFIFENAVRDISNLSQKSLLNPIKHNHLPALQYLVSVGYDPASAKYTAFVKAFRHARFEILEYLFSLGIARTPIPFDITQLLIQFHPPELYIKLFSSFSQHFKLGGFNSAKSMDFYLRLSQHETGSSLLSYFVDQFPSCKPLLITPVSNFDSQYSIAVRPVDLLPPFSRALCSVVYYYYRENCLLLLELNEYLLFDVIRYIFEFVIHSGFAQDDSIMQIDYACSKRKARGNQVDENPNLMEMLQDIDNGDDDEGGDIIIVDGEDEDEDEDENDESSFSGEEEFFTDDDDDEDSL